MFLPNSRYAKVKTVTAKARDGREVQAVALRRLANPSGIPTMVKGNDKLDVMAQRAYSDGTMFWHIADGNTELEANELVRVAGRVIQVPDQ
jgi:hypothetical protein